MPSKIIPADMFQKSLDRQRYEVLRKMICVDEIPDLEQRMLSSR